MMNGPLDEPTSERVCVEDQPQRAATFVAAAAGAPCPAHSRAPCANRFMVPMYSKNRKEAPHEPQDVLVRTILPHPSPLPKGEGELSSDDLKWRTMTVVRGPDACENIGRELLMTSIEANSP